MATRRTAVRLALALALALAAFGGLVAWFVLSRAASEVDRELAIAREGAAVPAVEAPAAPPIAPATPDTLRSGAPDPSEEEPGIVGSIHGIVLAASDTPIEGARVEAIWSAPLRDEETAGAGGSDEAERPPRTTAAVTDREGRFALANLRRGYHELPVSAAGFAPIVVARAPTGEAVLRIVLQPELFLSGEIVDRETRPVSGAVLRLVYLAADGNDARAAIGDRASPAPSDCDLHTAHSGNDGRFQIRGLSRGVYRAEAEKSGYARSIVPWITVHESDAGKPLHLVLEESQRIAGVVRGPGGAAVAEASVRVEFLRPPPTEGDPGRAPSAVQAQDRESQRRIPHERRTDDDGTFEFADLPAGRYALTAAASGYRTRRIAELDTGGERVEIELEAAAPLGGVVVDRRSGRAIAGAAVSAWAPKTEGRAGASRDGEIAHGLETDLEGRFVLDDVPAEAFIVRVEAEGYLTLEAETKLDPALPELRLALERGGYLGGRVRAASGSAVEGLRVTLIRQSERLTSKPRRIGSPESIDDAGRYQLPVPEAGTYRVLVEGDPYAASISQTIAMPEATAQRDGVDFHLQLAATLHGTVLGQDLAPVAGASVRVLPPRSRDEPEPAQDVAPSASGFWIPGEGWSSRCDALGEFELRGLAAGSFHVVAAAPGFVSARSEALELSPGGSHRVQIELEPEKTIAGSVQSSSGDPIPLAEVEAKLHSESRGEYWSEERTLASSLGTFRLSRLANRPYDLRASAEGFASALLEEVAAGSEGLRVELEPLVSLEGKVVGAFSGEPAGEFRLALKHEAPERLSARERELLRLPRDFRSGDGSFTIEGLPPGGYFVEAQAPGHLGGEALEIELAVDEGLADLVIPLREAGLIAGTVLDGRATGVSGVQVEALGQSIDPETGRIAYRALRQPRDDRASRETGRGGDRVGRATTRSDGSFFLRGLPDGIFRLRFTHDDFVARELGDYALENGAGAEATVAVRAFLDPGATLHGTVRGLAEVEGGALTLALWPRSNGTDPGARQSPSFKSAQVDATGRFEFRGLAAGNYTLSARYRRAADGSSATIRRSVEIHELDREKGIAIEISR